MTGLPALLRRLARDDAGSTLIEMAMVSPVLVMLGLGTYDTSMMVAKQHKLQAGAADMESIVLAISNGTSTDVTTIQTALATSLSMNASNIVVEKVYRCNAQTTVSTTNSCSTGQTVSTYVRVTFTDTYTPTWTGFGVGGPMNYSVKRTVQVS